MILDKDYNHLIENNDDEDGSYPASLATFLDERKGWARIRGIVGRRVGFLELGKMRIELGVVFS